MLLTKMMVMPLIGSILVGLMNEKRAKDIGLIVSIMTLWLGIWMGIKYNNGIDGFQFVEEYKWMEEKEIKLGIDGLGYTLILLSLFLMPVCILSSYESVKKMEKEFIISILVLETLLILSFSALDIIVFYISFESTLIPMFIIIGVWGGREEKVKAAYYMFMYTLIGSLLMLIGIFVIYYKSGTTSYESLHWLNIEEILGENVSKWVWLGLFASFGVKIPMVPFHLWLPKAHVEASVAGSVILGGIMLKLGGFGFIRYSLGLFPETSVYFMPWIYLLGILGVVYVSLTTLRQIDFKRVIAYSSVSHMGIVVLGLFSNNTIGIEGGIYLMLAHGITTSGLFICVTYIYERFHTRIIKYYRGLNVTMPLFCLSFGILSFSNLGLPLTCNFVGEVLSMLGIYQTNGLVGLLASTSVVFSAGYSLYLYNRIAFGEVSKYLGDSGRDLSRREWYVLVPFLILVFVMGIYPQGILNMLHSSVWYYTL